MKKTFLTLGTVLFLTGLYFGITNSNQFIVGAAQISVPSAPAQGYTLVGLQTGNYQATSTIFISSTRNVGIGTTSPSALLAVHGTGYISSTLFVGGVITSTSTASLSITGNAGTVTNGVYTTDAGTVYEVPLTAGDGLTRTVNDFDLDIPVLVASGGTGLTSFTGNRILYTNSAGTALAQTASSTLFGVTTPGFVWSYQNGAWGAFATSSSGGGTPAGSTGQLQYNNGGIFGAIATGIGSFFNNALGTLGFGTTTPQWLLQLASSTAPQLVLTDPTAGNATHWTFRNILGNLFLATSSPTTFATSTNSNPNQGFIEFPSNGGCVGCSDIFLTSGINLRNAKYVNATSTGITINVMKDVYTAPTGRRAFVSNISATNLTASNTTYAAYLKTGGIYYRLGVASTTVNAGAAGGLMSPNIVLEPGESIALLEATGAVNNVWINIIEYDSSVPFYSPRVTNPTANATTTLYTVPNAVSAVVTNANPQNGAGSTAVVSVGTSSTTAISVRLYNVKQGQTASELVNAANLPSGTVANGGGPVQLIASAAGGLAALNSGDTIKYWFLRDFLPGGASGIIYTTVFEH